MPQVRRIDIPDATIGVWGAIDELMAKEMYDGSFVNTVVVFYWSEERPSFGLGVHEDGDMLNVPLLKEKGFVCGRRYAWGGGLAALASTIPLVVFWYRKPYDPKKVNITSEAAIGGEIFTEGMRQVGFAAQYRPIGDLEVVQNGETYKVGATSGVNLHLPDYWSICASIVWGPIPASFLEVMGQAVRIPPEKFEDKKVKSFEGRMKPIAQIASDLALSLTVDKAVDSIVDAGVRIIYRTDYSAVQGSFTVDEQNIINSLVPFFESDPWINRVSTRRLCQRAPQGFRVGVAAYKSRKLVKASIILNNEGKIHDALFTGDWYIRPQPTITSMGVVEQLNNAVKGLNPADEAALTISIKQVFAQPDFDAPLIEPEHLVAPVMRAAEVAKPVSEYLAEN